MRLASARLRSQRREIDAVVGDEQAIVSAEACRQARSASSRRSPSRRRRASARNCRLPAPRDSRAILADSLPRSTAAFSQRSRTSYTNGRWRRLAADSAGQATSTGECPCTTSGLNSSMARSTWRRRLRHQLPFPQPAPLRARVGRPGRNGHAGWIGKMRRPLVIARCDDDRLDAVPALMAQDVLAPRAVTTRVMEDVVEDVEDANRPLHRASHFRLTATAAGRARRSLDRRQRPPPRGRVPGSPPVRRRGPTVFRAPIENRDAGEDGKEIVEVRPPKKNPEIRKPTRLNWNIWAYSATTLSARVRAAFRS